MSCRYVVLHHVGIAEPHFDFLFEMEPDAPALTSLRCPRWPVVLGDELLERPDHRRAYLDYEGPISGDRGSVSRVEAGTVDVVEVSVEPMTLGLRLCPSTQAAEAELVLVHRFGEAAADVWTVATVSS